MANKPIETTTIGAFPKPSYVPVRHCIDSARKSGGMNISQTTRDYTVEVTNNFQYMRDEIFERLKQHFTEEQIVELTLRTALCGFFNRFNDALQVGMEDGVVADMLAHGASEDTLPQHAAE